MQERRKAKRIAVELDVRFEVGREASRGRTLDVSTRGFFVQTKMPPVIGSILPFWIEFGEPALQLNVMGRIAHIRKDSHGAITGMGVEIKQIVRKQEEAFEAFRTFVERKLFQKD